MTKPTAAVLTVVLLLAGASILEAQCSKRILVYLDVSQSMDPRGRSVDSPFHHSLRALEALLDERGFLDSGDVVEIVLFGDRIEQRFSAQGPQEVGEKLRQVAAAATGRSWTDLGVAFADLAGSIQEGTFNRRVAIVVSDFLHEPGGVVPPERSWGAVFERWQPNLKGIFQDGQQVSLLLFRAPTSAGQRQAADVVIRDLTSSVVPAEQVYNIGRGGLDATTLAARIREKLLFPPEVSARLDKNDFERLELLVTNLNCYPLHLQEVSVACRRADGTRGGDPAPIAVPNDLVGLGPTGSPEATRVISAPKPKGACWDQATDFDVAALTREGVVGRSRGTTQTTVACEPVAGFLEYAFPSLRPVLRLELEMTGLVVEQRPLDVAVTGGGSDSFPVASGHFLPPRDLDPDQKRRYQMRFPVRGGVLARLEDGDRVEVSIRDGEKKSVEIRKDDLQTMQNTVAFWASVVTVLAFLGVFFFRRHSRRQALNATAVLGSWGQILVGLVPGLLFFFRSSFLQWFPMRLIDVLMLGSACLAAAFAVLVGIRTWQSSKLAAEVYGPQVITPESYDRKIRSAWVSWVGSAMVACIVLIMIFVLRPPVAPGAPGPVPIIPLVD